MKLSLSGFVFLLGYIVMIGVASFLEKFSMKQLNPYQINFLMAIGMVVTLLALIGAWITQLTGRPLAGMSQQHLFNDATVLSLFCIAGLIDALVHAKNL